MHFYSAFSRIEKGLVFPFRRVEIGAYLAVQPFQDIQIELRGYAL
jgi:hypothetical protein